MGERMRRIERILTDFFSTMPISSKKTKKSVKTRPIRLIRSPILSFKMKRNRKHPGQ